MYRYAIIQDMIPAGACITSCAFHNSCFQAKSCPITRFVPTSRLMRHMRGQIVTVELPGSHILALGFLGTCFDS